MEVLLENYPEGFLSQLGELLGKVVGLGEPSVKEKEFVDVIHIPVLIQGAEFGHYIITQFKDGKINSIRYEGDHPLKPQDIPRIGLTYSRSSERYKYNTDMLTRQDGWKRIVFPGIPSQVEKLLYSEYPSYKINPKFFEDYLAIHKK